MNSDVTDPLSVYTHYNILLETATHNASIYNALDQAGSFEQCSSLAQFQASLNQRRFLYAADPNVSVLLENIRGQLVTYPMSFLRAENLGPSVATKAVVPNDLWV